MRRIRVLVSDTQHCFETFQSGKGFTTHESPGGRAEQAVVVSARLSETGTTAWGGAERIGVFRPTFAVPRDELSVFACVTPPTLATLYLTEFNTHFGELIVR
jgi:hypothetical protein